MTAKVKAYSEGAKTSMAQKKIDDKILFQRTKINKISNESENKLSLEPIFGLRTTYPKHVNNMFNSQKIAEQVVLLHIISVKEGSRERFLFQQHSHHSTITHTHMYICMYFFALQATTSIYFIYRTWSFFKKLK